MNFKKLTIQAALTLAALTLVMPLWTTVAQAQSPSTGFGLGAIKVPGADKQKTGKGLSLGRSIFHAGLSLESGWDSNVFYSESGSTISSAYLRLLPQLTLGSRPVAAGKRQSFAYNLALGIDYIGYLQDLPVGAKKHYVGASVGADLKFNPRGIVSFALIEQFTRTNEPRVGLDGSADRDYNQVGFDLNITKGLLSFLLSYRFVLDFFEDSEYSFGNRMMHQAKFKATWRFFPQTSFWFLAESGFVSYFEDYQAPAAGVNTTNSDSVPVRLWLGATGRLTHWLTADIGLGYGFAWYKDSNPKGAHEFLANFGLGIKMGSAAKLSLGYRRDFRDSLVGDYFKSNSAYARLSVAIVQRLILRAMFAWTRADYQNYRPDGVWYTRVDNYLSGSVGADYYFTSWLSAGVGYNLQANIANTNAIGNSVPIEPNFLKHRVYGRVTAYY